MSLTDIIDLGKSMGLILGAAFYAAIVIWTYKDARKRTDDPIMVATFTAIAMLPLFGVLIYMLVRPSEYLADVRERELEIRALERQLGRQERCPYCKSHIEGEYLSCPVCTTKLRQSCTGCEKPLDPRWVMCPFCETEVPGGRGPAGPGSGGSARRPAGPVNTARSEPRPRRSSSESTGAKQPTKEPAKEQAKEPATDRSERKDRDRASTPKRDSAASKRDAAAAPKRDKDADSSSKKKKSDDIRTEPFGAGDTTRI
jgi:hypothetical protein